MSDAALTDRQLLQEAVAALREKDMERAGPLFAEFAERRTARIKARVANDVA